MTLTIQLELSSEQEERLRKKAQRAGLDVPSYVKHLTERSTRLRPARSRKPQTGAELADAIMHDPRITGYGDPGIDAPDLARDLRRQASSRDWSLSIDT